MGKIGPTKKQLEAYRLVRVHGLTIRQAGLICSISHTAIRTRIERLVRLHPELLETPRKKSGKTLSYDPAMDYSVTGKL